MSRIGSGGVASLEQVNLARKARLKELAQEFAKQTADPYLFRNHVGALECRLCLTVHPNEGNYLSHAQGRKHQLNLQKRAFKLKERTPAGSAPSSLTTAANSRPLQQHSAAVTTSTTRKPATHPPTPTIGRPGFRVLKQFDRARKRLSVLFALELPRIEAGLQPRHRFMSTFEQKKEAKNVDVQYVLFAAAPYSVIAFRIPNIPLDSARDAVITHWDADTKVFILQLMFQSLALPEGDIDIPAQDKNEIINET